MRHERGAGGVAEHTGTQDSRLVKAGQSDHSHLYEWPLHVRKWQEEEDQQEAGEETSRLLALAAADDRFSFWASVFMLHHKSAF